MAVGFNGADFAAKLRLQQQIQKEQGVKKTGAAQGAAQTPKPSVATETDPNASIFRQGGPQKPGDPVRPQDVKGQSGDAPRTNLFGKSGQSGATARFAGGASGAWNSIEKKMASSFATTSFNNAIAMKAQLQNPANTVPQDNNNVTDGVINEQNQEYSAADGDKSTAESKSADTKSAQADQSAKNADKTSDSTAKSSQNIEKALKKDTKALQSDMKKTEKSIQQNDKNLQTLSKKSQAEQAKMDTAMSELEELTSGDNTGVGKSSANSLTLAGTDDENQNSSSINQGQDENGQRVEQLSQEIKTSASKMATTTKAANKIEVKGQGLQRTAARKVSAQQKYYSSATKALKQNQASAKNSISTGQKVQNVGQTVQQVGQTTQAVGAGMQAAGIVMQAYTPTAAAGKTLETSGVKVDNVGQKTEKVGQGTEAAGKLTSKLGGDASEKTTAAQNQAKSSVKTGAMAAKQTKTMAKSVKTMGKTNKTIRQSGTIAAANMQRAEQMKQAYEAKKQQAIS